MVLGGAAAAAEAAAKKTEAHSYIFPLEPNRRAAHLLARSGDGEAAD